MFFACLLRGSVPSASLWPDSALFFLVCRTRLISSGSVKAGQGAR